MLGLAELRAAQADLQSVGTKYDGLIADFITEDTTKVEGLTFVRSLIPDYQTEYQLVLTRMMKEVAENAIKYYEQALNIEDLDVEGLAEEIAERQFKEKYYGASLDQRLRVNERVLTRRAAMTAQAGVPKLAGVFTNPVPNGAQVNIDKRVLIGTAAKIENDVAKELAGRGSIRLIKWTLSGRHSITCQCDDLAAAINRDVVLYLESRDSKMNPKGLYFAENLPLPPHPNCQCEYGMVSNDKVQRPSRSQRTVKKVLSLLKRIRRK